MRGHFCLIAIAVLAPCAAEAQTTTADGVRAVIRGDYATAALILRPLAEERPNPDPLALFFMASLYHSGHGVAMNEIRACGLYLRAATPANPLLAQSLALAQTIHMDHPYMRDQCSAASAATWSEPPVSSFTLGPDHWMRIDHAGFVVGHKGTTKRANMTLGGPGWVFFPIRYTRLDVSRPAAVGRHFVEFFSWIPHTVSDETRWTLLWSAYEVRGADTFPVSRDGVVAIIAAERSPGPFAVEDAVRIRVNADGEAEWIVSGANPRSGVIPYTEPR